VKVIEGQWRVLDAPTHWATGFARRLPKPIRWTLRQRLFWIWLAVLTAAVIER
jgi:hypothetical protein